MGIGRGAGQARPPLPSQSVSFQKNAGRGRPGVYAVAPEDNEHGEEPGTNILTGTILVCSILAKSLFDSGASNYFISAQFVAQNKLPTTLLDKILSYGTDGGQVIVNSIIQGCALQIGEKKSKSDLIILPLPFIDIILGMDWLSSVKAQIDCKKKTVTFQLSGEAPYEFQTRDNIKF